MISKGVRLLCSEFGALAPNPEPRTPNVFVQR